MTQLPRIFVRAPTPAYFGGVGRPSVTAARSLASGPHPNSSRRGTIRSRRHHGQPTPADATGWASPVVAVQPMVGPAGRQPGAVFAREDADIFCLWLAGPMMLAIHAWRSLRSLFNIFGALALSVTIVAAFPRNVEDGLNVLMTPRLIPYAIAAAALVFLLGRWQQPLSCFVTCFTLGMVATAHAGWSVKDLPPDFHDEYSYLFQAWTFLSGRVSYPADELSSCFAQVHVLDHPVFVSRYFPGTGLWLAPFLAIALIVGWWSRTAPPASSLWRAALSPATGYRGNTVATNPALGLLGNMLLSPTPTMWASRCSWAFLNIRVTAKALADSRGCGNRLCIPYPADFRGRPGLLLAAYALFRVWHQPPSGYRARFALLVGSFAVWPAILGLFNYATSATRSNRRTDVTRTTEPSHVYGFTTANARTETGTHTLVAYDDWAENLTPDLLPRLLGGRLIASQRGHGRLPATDIVTALRSGCKPR